MTAGIYSPSPATPKRSNAAKGKRTYGVDKGDDDKGTSSKRKGPPRDLSGRLMKPPEPQDPRVKELQRRFKKVVPDDGDSNPEESQDVLRKMPMMERSPDRISGATLLGRYLSESRPIKEDNRGKLTPSMRKAGNEVLRKSGFDGNRHFRTIGAAMGSLAAALRKGGIEIDETVSADHFRAKTGSVALRIAFSNKEQPMAPKEITNSMVAVNWTEMQSGVEVVAYLS